MNNQSVRGELTANGLPDVMTEGVVGRCIVQSMPPRYIRRSVIAQVIQIYGYVRESWKLGEKEREKSMLTDIQII